MDNKLRTVLLPGERVLWEGRPAGGLILQASDIVAIPFTLLWGGFAVFWNVSVWNAAPGVDDWFFKLWGLPFLAVGLYITVGRFIFDMWMRSQLRYAVTDRRVLIMRVYSSTVRSLDIRSLPMLELEERTDGSGTIRFDSAPSIWGNRGFESWQPAASRTPQFIRIERVRYVYDLICRQQAATA